MPSKPKKAKKPAYLCVPCERGQHRVCLGTPHQPCRCTNPVHRRKTDPGAR